MTAPEQYELYTPSFQNDITTRSSPSNRATRVIGVGLYEHEAAPERRKASNPAGQSAEDLVDLHDKQEG